MRKTRIAFIIIAVALILAGAAICTVVLASTGFDLSKFNNKKLVTNTYDVDEDFRDISIKTSTADVVFEPSQDGKCRVVCLEEEKQLHSVSVRDGALTIEVKDSRKWYERFGFFGINFSSPKVTVYLPGSSYASMTVTSNTGDVTVPKDFNFDSIKIDVDTGNSSVRADVGNRLEIKSSTGDILVENITAGEIKFKTSTGNIRVNGVNCKGAVSAELSTGDSAFTDLKCASLDLHSSTGNVSLTRTVVSGKMRLETSTGNIRFDRSDAAEIYAETNTGDITGSFLTEKVILADTDTGKISVPKSVSGGRCELKTDTGDIRIDIE